MFPPDLYSEGYHGKKKVESLELPYWNYKPKHPVYGGIAEISTNEVLKEAGRTILIILPFTLLVWLM